MSDERWLSVRGYEGYYEVSDQGRVRSVDRVTMTRAGYSRRDKGRVLRDQEGAEGRRIVTLSVNSDVTTRSVHRIVLETFVGPCPDGMEACHWDDDCTNNRLENLRWDTHESNCVDRERNGKNHESNKTHCPRGHPYDLFYAYGRKCSICKNESNRRSKRKAKA